MDVKIDETGLKQQICTDSHTCIHRQEENSFSYIKEIISLISNIWFSYSPPFRMIRKNFDNFLTIFRVYYILIFRERGVHLYRQFQYYYTILYDENRKFIRILRYTFDERQIRHLAFTSLPINFVLNLTRRTSCVRLATTHSASLCHVKLYSRLLSFSFHLSSPIPSRLWERLESIENPLCRISRVEYVETARNRFFLLDEC